MKDIPNRRIISMNQNSYNQIAEEFSATRGYMWKDIEYLFKFVKSNDKILDAGCGNGRLLETTNYRLQPTNYLGVDNSEGLINEARKKYPEFKFEVKDILRLENGIEKNNFDAIFCVAVLNHFPQAYQNQVLQNLKKALKPGGYLLMANWNLWNVKNKKGVWHNPNKNRGIRMLRINKDVITTWKSGDKEVSLYYYAFTKGEIRRLLQKNGFVAVKNFYSTNNNKSSMLFGNNIITVAQKK